MRAMTAILFASLSLSYATAARAAETDWKKVDLVFGRAAAVSRLRFIAMDFPEATSRSVSMACSSRRALRSAVGSRSSRWATRHMMMGDLVLTEAEINAVRTKLLRRVCRRRPCATTAARSLAHHLHARVRYR